MLFLQQGNDVVVGEKDDWNKFDSAEDPLQIICSKSWFDGSNNAKIFELQLFRSEKTKNYYKKTYRIRYRRSEPKGFGDEEEEDQEPVRLFEERKIEEISRAESKVIQKKEFGGKVKIEDQPANEEEAKRILAEED